MNKNKNIQLALGLFLFLTGVNSLISGETTGFGLVSQKTRPITPGDNPIEFFLMVAFELICGLWLLRHGLFGKKD